jgi:hypothetical protein
MTAQVITLPVDPTAIARHIVAAQDRLARLTRDPDSTRDQRIEATIEVARLMRRLIDDLRDAPL